MSDTHSWPRWDNPRIVLYHGTLAASASSIVRHGVDISVGRPNTDFGRGFYTTTVPTQAMEWAEEVGSETGKPSAVVQLSLDRLVLRSLRSLAFVQGSTIAIDYWSFVSHCRRQHQKAPATAQDYDVVYGPVARTWFGENDSEVFPGYDQISFHGPEAERVLRTPDICRVEIVK